MPESGLNLRFPGRHGDIMEVKAEVRSEGVTTSVLLLGFAAFLAADSSVDLRLLSRYRSAVPDKRRRLVLSFFIRFNGSFRSTDLFSDSASLRLLCGICSQDRPIPQHVCAAATQTDDPRRRHQNQSQHRANLAHFNLLFQLN